MKKLLSILGAISLTGTAVTSVVACGEPLETPDPGVPPTLYPEDIFNLLRQEINRQVQSHLLSKTNVFQIKDKLAEDKYNFFTAEKIEKYAENLSTSNKFEKVDLESEDASKLLIDLEQILQIGDLRSQLEELRKDENFGYGLYLNGLDSNKTILEDLKLSNNESKIEIKKTGTDENITYQIKVSFDMKWIYVKDGEQSEDIKNNVFMFTVTSDSKLNEVITKFNNTYKANFLKSKGSLTNFEAADLERGKDEASGYEAYSEIQESNIQSWYKNNGVDLDKQLQAIIDSIAGNNDFKLDFSNGSIGLERYFDFFDNGSTPLKYLVDSNDEDGIYYYLQNKVLGNWDNVPNGVVQSNDSNDLLYKAVGQILYNSVPANSNSGGTTIVNGQNLLSSLTYTKLNSMLVENGFKEMEINVLQKEWDNIWSMGYIVLSGVEFKFGDSSISLGNLNIPYTYSIEGLTSKTTSIATSEEQDTVIKTLSTVVEYWTKTIHELLKIETANQDTIMRFSKESEIYKELTSNPIITNNPKDIKKESLQTVINNTMAKLNKNKLFVDFDFFVQLSSMSFENNELWVTIANVDDLNHLYVKLGFFNFYLYSHTGKATSKIRQARQKNIAAMKFSD